MLKYKKDVVMSIISREFKVKAKGLKFPEGPISMNDGSIILV